MKENTPIITDTPIHIVITNDNYLPIVRTLKRIANKMDVDEDLVHDFIERIISGSKRIEIGNRQIMSTISQKFKNFAIDNIRHSNLKKKKFENKKLVVEENSAHAEFLSEIIKDLEGIDRKIILSELLWLYACKETKQNREEFKINIADIPSFNPELLKEFETKAVSYSEILAEIPMTGNQIRKKKWNLYKSIAKKYPNFEEILHGTNNEHVEYQDYDSNLRIGSFK